jgi:integrase
MQPELLPSEYLDFYQKEKTRKLYQTSLRAYLSIVTGKPIHADTDTAWLNYLNGPDTEPAHDLMNFVRTCEHLPEKLAPRSILTYMSAAERYLRDCCNIELTPKQKMLRNKSMPKNKPITQDAILRKSDIKAILTHADERLAAEILLGVSSGMRIGEILSFTFDDLNQDAEPVTIRIRPENSKNGIGRTVYISTEAAAALNAWIKIREHGLDNRAVRCGGKGLKDMAVVIPFTTTNEQYRLVHALQKAGYADRDTVTHRHKVHFHSFRKYFITQFKLAASVDVAEALAGHEGYLDGAYRRISEEQMQREYRKAEPFLCVLTPDDYEELKYSRSAEIQELQQANSHLLAKVSMMEAVLQQVKYEQERQGVASQAGIPYRRYSDDIDGS